MLTVQSTQISSMLTTRLNFRQYYIIANTNKKRFKQTFFKKSQYILEVSGRAITEGAYHQRRRLPKHTVGTRRDQTEGGRTRLSH